MDSTSTISIDWAFSPEGFAVLMVLGLAFSLVTLYLKQKLWTDVSVAPHYENPRVTGIIAEIRTARDNPNDRCYIVRVPKTSYLYFLDYNDCDSAVYEQLKAAQAGDQVTLDIYGDPEMGMHFENLILSPRRMAPSHAD